MFFHILKLVNKTRSNSKYHMFLVYYRSNIWYYNKLTHLYGELNTRSSFKGN